jgi:hypothetical protein
VSELVDDPAARLTRLARTLDALPAGRVLATSTEPEDEMLGTATLTLEVLQALKGSFGSRIDAPSWDHADHLVSRVMLRNLQSAATSLRWTARRVARRLDAVHVTFRDIERFLAKEATIERQRAERMSGIEALRTGDDQG